MKFLFLLPYSEFLFFLFLHGFFLRWSIESDWDLLGYKVFGMDGKMDISLKIVPLDGGLEVRRENENVGNNNIILGVDVVADIAEGHNALIDSEVNDGLDFGSGPSLVSVHCNSDGADSLDAIFGPDLDKPVKK